MKQNDKWHLLIGPNFNGALKEEAQIQYEVVNYLRQLSIQGQLNAIWFSIPNEFAGEKKRFFGGYLKALGKISGTPDLALMWQTGSGFIEFKSEKGKLSKNQKLFREWCDEQGINYEIARSVKDGEEILRNWGLID